MPRRYQEMVAAAAQLRGELHRGPRGIHIRLAGEIDLATRDQLTGMVQAVLRTASLIELDLAEVTFCDCAGITALVRLQESAHTAGAHIVLTRPKPIVQRVLVLTGVAGLFNSKPLVSV